MACLLSLPTSTPPSPPFVIEAPCTSKVPSRSEIVLMIMTYILQGFTQCSMLDDSTLIRDSDLSQNHRFLINVMSHGFSSVTSTDTG